MVQKLKEWVDTLLPRTPPNSALGKALARILHSTVAEVGSTLCYDKVGAQASLGGWIAARDTQRSDLNNLDVSRASVGDNLLIVGSKSGAMTARSANEKAIGGISMNFAWQVDAVNCRSWAG